MAWHHHVKRHAKKHLVGAIHKHPYFATALALLGGGVIVYEIKNNKALAEKVGAL